MRGFCGHARECAARVALDFKPEFASECLTFVGFAEKGARPVRRNAHGHCALWAARIIVDSEGIEKVALFI